MRIRSFTFPEPSALPPLDANSRSPPPAVSPDPPPAASHCTRIKPPHDIIKLADRLHYLLQPSLESLLAEGSLCFPVRPFPFQFEGIAFLYPRQAAILADEMGLGKTMQAITAIRLLLRRGEVRSVLLVCPKPLVTNWQREFALWAPEVPLMVIEGDQAKRGWQWALPDVPLRVANYELLLRDRDLLAGQAFDLVVLDESQRIKNRSGSTSEVVCSISRKRNWASDRHAGREQRRRPVGHLRIPRPRLPLARDEAPQHGPIHPRLRPADAPRTRSSATCRRN